LIDSCSPSFVLIKDKGGVLYLDSNQSDSTITTQELKP